MKKHALIVLTVFLLSATLAAADYRGNLKEGDEVELWIDSYSTLPEEPQTGFNDIILQVDFKHTGTATYKNMSFQAQTPPQLEGVRTNFYISYMKPDDTFTTSYRFHVNEDTAPGIYTVPIRINYTDIAGEGDKKVTITREAKVKVSDKTRVEIIKINQEDKVVPGDSFKTEVTVKNIGNTPSNLLETSISLPNKSKGIYWQRSKKTTQYLPQGQEKTITFQGKTSESLKNGLYSAKATVKNGDQTQNNSFTITIQGEPKLTSAGINVGEELLTGKKASISLQLENIGEGDAKAVSVELEKGEFQGSTAEQIGTIEFDETGTAIFDLNFKSPGEQELTFNVDYLDEAGEKHSKTIKGSVYVEKTPRDYTTIIIAVIVLAAVIYFFYWRMKKKKEAREIDV